MLLVAFGEERATRIATPGHIGIAQTDARIEGPLLVAAETTLPSDVDKARIDLTLIAATLPFEVAVACTDAKSDVPTTESMMEMALSKPTANLE